MYYWGQYYSDKYLLFKQYRKPPAYDATLALRFVENLPNAGLLSVALTAFAFSNEALLADGGKVSSHLATWLEEVAQFELIGGRILLRLNRLPVS